MCLCIPNLWCILNTCMLFPCQKAKADKQTNLDKNYYCTCENLHQITELMNWNEELIHPSIERNIICNYFDKMNCFYHLSTKIANISYLHLPKREDLLLLLHRYVTVKRIYLGIVVYLIGKIRSLNMLPKTEIL